MKRLIGLLLLGLLLCGCAQEPQPTTQPAAPTTEYVAPTEPAGSYLPGSEAETASGGAVRAYGLDQVLPYALDVWGGNLLVFSGSDQSTLTLLAGDNLYPIAETTLDTLVHPKDGSFRITEKGITYFDPMDESLVYLDGDLKEISRRQLDAQITGKPVLSRNRMKLYYCTADAVRVMDLETGIDRLLKQISYPDQQLKAILLEDTVLYCAVADEEGERSIFLSAETGEQLYLREGSTEISGDGKYYYASIVDGAMMLSLFGTGQEEPRQLSPRDPFAEVMYVDNLHGAVSFDGAFGAITLEYYDLESGRSTAELHLPGIAQPHSICADPASGYLYLLARNVDSEECLLYRWESAKSAMAEDTVYTHPQYTRKSPDAQGLALCQDRAYSLSQTYGVEVLVGMEAVAKEPWDYELYPEHQVPVINRMLDELETVLSGFPAGFFQTLTEKTTHVPVKISLVRSMYGSPESGSLETANGIQFWNGDEPYVVLGYGPLLQRTFYHEMFHVIESCVYGYSNAYDDWNKLNPKGFSYDNDYLSYQNRTGDTYLKDKDRAFIDSYSMTYPKEDRARILEYAAMEGNEAYFQTKTMQQKLTTLCKGIREAFDLREYPNVLPWEQYLKKPLTP